MAQRNNVQLAQKEGRIALAVQAFKQGQISSLHVVVKVYDVFETTLWGRVKGITAQRNVVSINQKLMIIEETTFIK